MKIIVHTKYGTYESREQESTEEVYEKLKKFLSNIANYKYISVETKNGYLYMTSAMINDSVFLIEKENYD